LITVTVNCTSQTKPDSLLTTLYYPLGNWVQVPPRHTVYYFNILN